MEGISALLSPARRCTRCERQLPVIWFGKDRSKPSGVKSRCRECLGATITHVCQTGRSARGMFKHELSYVKAYGITPVEYERMFAAQAGTCAICRRSERVRNNVGGTKRLAVDHDHRTGQVRGLLCHACNVSIGQMGDDPMLLLRAARYLAEASK